MVRKIFHIVFWCLLGTGCVVLLVAAMDKKDDKVCSAVKVDIRNHQNANFVSEKEILSILSAHGIKQGRSLASVQLHPVEKLIANNPWVQDAEIFLDNNNVFYAIIRQRIPVARVFTLGSTSFYIDSNGLRLPLINNQQERLTVFTGFTSERKILSAPDSLVLNDITSIAGFIHKDSFWNAQIAQVNITPERTYQLVPVIGNHLIELGDATQLEEKFEKLFAFYKQVLAVGGFDLYEKIDVRYNKQIVAVQHNNQNNSAFHAATSAKQILPVKKFEQDNYSKDTQKKNIEKSKIISNATQTHTEVKQKENTIKEKEIILEQKIEERVPKAVMQKPGGEDND